MKFFYAVCSVTFISVGSVIGAGFISGRELVSFFGTGNYLPYLIFASFLLSLFFLILFIVGRNSQDLKRLNEKVFNNEKVVSIAVLIATFISVSTLLAGVDSLVKSTFTINFPICSLVLLILVSLFSNKGIKGVERLSVILIPLVIIIATFMILRQGDFGYFGGVQNEGGGMISAILYASMNAFINLPPLVECAFNKPKKALVLSAFLSGLILFFEGYIILNVVLKKGTFEADVPLLSAIGENGGVLFFITLFSAMVTSIFSAYYPLYFFAKEKGGGFGIVILFIACFCFSRLGIKNLIGYVYPLIGAFGVLYLYKCLKLIFKEKINRYKNLSSDNNKIKEAVYEKEEK